MIPYKPKGAANADLYIIGEAPSRTDSISDYNFSSPDGLFLLRVLAKNGIQTRHCRIGYVSDMRTLQQDILDTKPKVILAVGQQALFMTTGQTGILKHRGSVYPYMYDPDIKVVPVVDGKFIRGNNWPYLYSWHSDINKAKTILNGSFKQTTRTFYHASNGTTFNELCSILERYASHHGLLTYDIEGWYPRLACISFATCPEEAISVPLNGVFPAPMQTILERLVKEVLANPHTGKIAHNMLFDNAVLAMHGYEVVNVFMDTMLAHHTVYQDMPHSLHFVSSIYTNEQYYKDDRTLVEFTGVQQDADDYSCKDSAVLFELIKPLIKELQTHGVTRFFFDVIMPRVKAVGRMQARGMPWDQTVADHMSETIEHELLLLEHKLLLYPGVNPHSPDTVRRWVYDPRKDNGLGIKALKGRGRNATKKPSTSEDAIARAIPMLKNKREREALMDVLHARKLRKQTSTYLTSQTFLGRMYYGVNIGPRPTKTGYSGGTPSGRLSMGKLLDGSGIPAQGIPKGLKSPISPGPGLVIWEADKSQIEARIVAWLAGEDFLVDCFLDGQDVHRLTGVLLHPLLFNKPIAYEDVKGLTRQFYKKLRHAMNYSMGPGQLKKEVNKELPEMSFTAAQAKAAIASFHEVHVGTHAWQEDIRYGILSGRRTFTNCYGRLRIAMGSLERNEDLIRSMLAFEPSSTAADHTLIGLTNADRDWDSLGLDPDRNYIMNQVHDSLVGVCEVDNIPIVKSYILGILAEPVPLTYNNHPLIIPTDFQAGPNWRDMEEV